jgi:hypothetical protein
MVTVHGVKQTENEGIMKYERRKNWHGSTIGNRSNKEITG